jgi:protein-tyrosine phosphatase
MLRVLAVCTGNVCRSPVVERLLDHHLSAAGYDVAVRSAGTHAWPRGADGDTVLAARAIGVDLSDHVARHLSADLVATEGADLVVTMTFEHLRTVVALDRNAWPRTFTLKELARNAANVTHAHADVASWLDAIGAARRAVDLLAASPDDDLPDPIGRPYEMHVEMVDEVSRLVTRIAAQFPR